MRGGVRAHGEGSELSPLGPAWPDGEAGLGYVWRWARITASTREAGVVDGRPNFVSRLLIYTTYFVPFDSVILMDGPG